MQRQSHSRGTGYTYPYPCCILRCSECVEESERIHPLGHITDDSVWDIFVHRALADIGLQQLVYDRLQSCESDPQSGSIQRRAEEYGRRDAQGWYHLLPFLIPAVKLLFQCLDIRYTQQGAEDGKSIRPAFFHYPSWRHSNHLDHWHRMKVCYLSLDIYIYIC